MQAFTILSLVIVGFAAVSCRSYSNADAYAYGMIPPYKGVYDPSIYNGYPVGRYPYGQGISQDDGDYSSDSDDSDYSNRREVPNNFYKQIFSDNVYGYKKDKQEGFIPGYYPNKYYPYRLPDYGNAKQIYHQVYKYPYGQYYAKYGNSFSDSSSEDSSSNSEEYYNNNVNKYHKGYGSYGKAYGKMNGKSYKSYNKGYKNSDKSYAKGYSGYRNGYQGYDYSY